MTPVSPRRLVVLILIPHYLPGTNSGGPVRTISNLVELLGDQFDFRIIALDHDHSSTVVYPGVQRGKWQPVGKAQVRYLTTAEQLPWKLRTVIRSCNYDLVYLNGIYPNLIISFLLLRRLRLLRDKPVLIAPRGHLEDGALSIKSRKKQLFLGAARLTGLLQRLSWHAASPSEEHEILRALKGTPLHALQVVSNLSRISYDAALAKKIDKTPHELNVIFLSRISAMKNLIYALNVLKNISGTVRFDIYGPLEDKAYWKVCEEIINTLPSNISVTYRGALAQDEVVAALSGYHLFFLPTLGENFGHAILESLSAGCPVLISDKTPWTDIQGHEAGWALPLDHPQAFVEVIQKMVDAGADEMDRRRQQARKYAMNYLAASNAVEEMGRFLSEIASVGRDISHE